MFELPTSLIAEAIKNPDIYLPATLALAAVFATVAQLEINLASGIEEEPVAVVEEEVATEVEEEAATEPEEEAATEEPEASEPPKEDEEECVKEEKVKTFRKVRSVAKALYAPWLGMVSNRFK
jgi:hypothetical protein